MGIEPKTYLYAPCPGLFARFRFHYRFGKRDHVILRFSPENIERAVAVARNLDAFFLPQIKLGSEGASTSRSTQFPFTMSKESAPPAAFFFG